jgi:predicted TIM-barrel fold metal-dependent hydrolase
MTADVSRTGRVSADSHVVEAPDVFTDRLPSAWRDRAPHIEPDGNGGDHWIVPGLDHPVPLGFARPSADTDSVVGPSASTEQLRPGGADPVQRLLDQDLDGVTAELLFPTLGLVLLRQPDLTLRRACADAYNRWLAEFCAHAPDRLWPVAVVAPAAPDDALDTLDEALAREPAGIMLPIRPPGPDWHDPAWAPLFDAVAAAGRPVCFHALGGPARPARGPRLVSTALLPHETQELLAVLALGGVLDRRPHLHVVLAEADASWMPHFARRLDRIHSTHAGWSGASPLERSMIDTLDAQVWLAFANDELALQIGGQLNPARLMWGNDYPHAEGTWPRSDASLEQATIDIDPAVVRGFVGDNARTLFGK